MCFSAFLLLFLFPFLDCRQVPDGVVLEHNDALQRDSLSFETRLLNHSSSSSSHSTVEVLQNPGVAAATSTAAALARSQRLQRARKTTAVKRQFRDVAKRNLMRDDFTCGTIGCIVKEERESTPLSSSSSPPTSSSRPPSAIPLPGDTASTFRLYTLNKGVLHYPDDLFFLNVSVLFVTFNNLSGFSSVSWTDQNSLKDFVTSTPDDARFIFFSAATDAETAASEALWMRSQIQRAVDDVRRTMEGFTAMKIKQFVRDRCAFVVTPLSQVGNWIPNLLQRWSCSGHGCGYDQIVFEAKNSWLPLVLKRIDARYDWLPTPSSTFGNETLSAKVVPTDGCQPVPPLLRDSVAIVMLTGGCDVVDKIGAMNESGRWLSLSSLLRDIP